MALHESFLKYLHPSPSHKKDGVAPIMPHILRPTICTSPIHFSRLPTPNFNQLNVSLALLLYSFFSSSRKPSILPALSHRQNIIVVRVAVVVKIMIHASLDNTPLLGHPS